jgi:DNA-binding transcriptional regulator YiaG
MVVSEELKYDRYFAKIMRVSVMTIGRWRRKQQTPPECMSLLAKLLHERGELEALPDWLTHKRFSNGEKV